MSSGPSPYPAAPCPPSSPLKIFFWGQLGHGSTAKARYEALVALGHQVVPGSNYEIYRASGRVSYHLGRRLGIGWMVSEENRALEAAVQGDFDLIWIEKGIFIRPSTVAKLRPHARTLLHFTPDPAFNYHTKTRHFLNGIRYYDAFGTTKPGDLELYRSHGAKRVLLLPKTYNPAFHKLYPEDQLDATRADIAFVGSWTPDKERILKLLVKAFPERTIRIYGSEWQRKCRDVSLLQRHCGPARGVYGEDYGRAIAGARVCLGLLSWDIYPDEVITDRILEIPACGSLLVAPRTGAIEEVFQDGQSALLFSDDADLIDKVGWALDHEADRLEISRRGTATVQSGEYRDMDMVRLLLDRLQSGS